MDYKKLAHSVFEAQNQVRRDPKSFIPKLEAMLKCFDGTLYRKPGKIPLRTNEGPAAIHECIEFLKRTNPLPEFVLSDGMSKACHDHANDIGSRSMVSHNGSDGSSFSQRLERYGEWGGTVGENCEFGSETGEEVIISLLVDDGVSSRGHRKNIFNPEFKFVGVGCGYHKAYDHCTVLDYAAKYGPKGQKSQDIGGFSSNFTSPSFGGPSWTTTTHSQQPASQQNFSNNFSYSNPNDFKSDPYAPSGSYGYSNPTTGNNTQYSSYTTPQYSSYTNSSNSNPQSSSYGNANSTPQYSSYSYQTPNQNNFDLKKDDFLKDFNNGNVKTTYSTGPYGTESVQTTTYNKSYGDSSVLNDPFIAQHLGKVKSQTDFSSTNLREMAQKEAPPGATGWTVNSNVEISNGKKISRVTTTYKFPDGSTKEITKEIVEGL